jgi:hypothetical protein
MSKEWIKHYLSELDSPIMIKLTLEERAIWHYLLLLAGKSDRNGYIEWDEETPMALKRMAELINTDLSILEEAVVKLKKENMIIKEEDGRYKIVNYDHYQYTPENKSHKMSPQQIQVRRIKTCIDVTHEDPRIPLAEDNLRNFIKDQNPDVKFSPINLKNEFSAPFVDCACPECGIKHKSQLDIKYINSQQAHKQDDLFIIICDVCKEKLHKEKVNKVSNNRFKLDKDLIDKEKK